MLERRNSSLGRISVHSFTIVSRTIATCRSSSAFRNPSRRSLAIAEVHSTTVPHQATMCGSSVASSRKGALCGSSNQRGNTAEESQNLNVPPVLLPVPLALVARCAGISLRPLQPVDTPVPPRATTPSTKW